MSWRFVVQTSLVICIQACVGMRMKKERERERFNISCLRKEGPKDKEAQENKTNDAQKSSGVRKRSQRCVWQETRPWCHAMPQMGVVFSSSPRWWMMRHQWEPTGKAGTGIGTNVWSWLLCHKLRQDSKDWIAQVCVCRCVCVYVSVLRTRLRFRRKEWRHFCDVRSFSLES